MPYRLSGYMCHGNMCHASMFVTCRIGSLVICGIKWRNVITCGIMLVTYRTVSLLVCGLKVYMSVIIKKSHSLSTEKSSRHIH